MTARAQHYSTDHDQFDDSVILALFDPSSAGIHFLDRVLLGIVTVDGCAA